jgi:hypothetical protein
MFNTSALYASAAILVVGFSTTGVILHNTTKAIETVTPVAAMSIADIIVETHGELAAGLLESNARNFCPSFPDDGTEVADKVRTAWQCDRFGY